MLRPLKPGVSGTASFVLDDGVKVARLRLDRCWDPALHVVEAFCSSGTVVVGNGRYRPLVVIGTNPSTAGATHDDNTIAKVETFARREGANGLVMVNLHPGISTDPDELANVLLPEGAGERHWAAVASALAEDAVAFVAAWGKPPKKLSSYRDRVGRVRELAGNAGVNLVCFGENGDGSPKHPLYLKGTTPLVPYYIPRSHR